LYKNLTDPDWYPWAKKKSGMLGSTKISDKKIFRIKLNCFWINLSFYSYSCRKTTIKKYTNVSTDKYKYVFHFKERILMSFLLVMGKNFLDKSCMVWKTTNNKINFRKINFSYKSHHHLLKWKYMIFLHNMILFNLHVKILNSKVIKKSIYEVFYFILIHFDIKVYYFK